MSTGGPNPPSTPHVKAMNCPGCGAALSLRSFTQAVTVVCDSCHSILDAQDPQLKILQRFQKATGEDPPLIPLGSRGKIRGTLYEAVGFQRRTIQVEGIAYSWHEYVLFNPYKGFRYLTEYNGHWNDTATLRALPTLTPYAGQVSVAYLGENYRHFQTAQASTTFVLGEFYENQPSPFTSDTKTIWTIFGAFAIFLLLMMLGFSSFARDEQAFQGAYTFDTSARGEASFVTDPFELKGRTSTFELSTTTNVDNNWIYLNYALINQDTGQAYDFGREVSYYHGYDSDGSWTEGSRSDSVAIPSVPPGTYYLRVEPESDSGHGTIHYEITAKRDVPQFSFFGIALLALLVPAALITWRSMNFEHLRWAESDHAPMESSTDSGGDDD